MRRTKCKNGVWLLANPEKDQYLYFSPPCKLKSCPACSRMMQKRHILRISQFASNLEFSHLIGYFLTLTLPSWWHEKPPEDGLNHLRKKWGLMRKRLNRLYKELYWVKTFERHKSGVYHLHVLLWASAKIFKKDIRKMIRELKLGFQFALLPISEDAVRYVAKYSTKSGTQGRVIEYSRNFPRLTGGAYVSPLQWEYVGNVQIGSWISFLTRVGAKVILLSQDPDDPEFPDSLDAPLNGLESD